MTWIIDALRNAWRLVRNTLVRAFGRPPDFIVVELVGSYPERRAPRRPLWQRVLSGSWQRPEESLEALRERLERIAAAPGVQGIVLRMGELRAGMATIQSLRAAFAEVRRGKRVVAYLPEAHLSTYYLATAADSIQMAPAGFWMVSGLRTEITFFRSAFDRLGVLPEFERIAEYKTAADPFMRSGLSEPHREVIESILDSMMQEVAGDMAAARRLDSSAVLAAIDRAPRTADEARSLGLIDGVCYEDELPARLGTPEHPASLQPWARARRRLPSPYRWRAGQALIGVVELRGAIVPGESRDLPVPLPLIGGRLAGSDTVARAFRAAERHPGVRAIVFSVDSRGGSALASDLIWREVERVKGRKPVVVHMGDVAGSGGYYVAAGASRIVAQPGTMTGSIGVVAGKLTVQALLERLGLNREVVARGQAATMESAFRPFSAEQLQAVRREMETIYHRFVGVVARGRRQTEDSVEVIARGRVWTGRQAFKHGLVDELGDLSLAVRRAADLAGIPASQRVTPVTIHPPQTVGIPSSGRGGSLDGVLDALQAVQALAAEGVWLIMPDTPGI
jgi:protease-4